MLSFECDYNTGAHPKILEKFSETNFIAEPGYGDDCFSKSAKDKIRKAIDCPEADIYFLAGGTQTNQLCIDSMLANYEGVVAAESGHINTHESGAIEYTGRKVMTIPEHEGKIKASELDEFVETFYLNPTREHMIFPGMLYISHPTELGSLYTKAELKEISKVCKKHNMSFYIDGARMGYGIASYETDVTLSDIAKYADAFYIGGTKVGALCGEALVFTKNNTPPHFINLIKKHGALLAKGRLVGIQFDTLFTDNLYFEIGRHAIDMAKKLIEACKEAGLKFFYESPTNQQFFIIENELMEKISDKVRYSYWEKYDDTHSVIRFATSWSTRAEDIEALKKILYDS